MKKLLIILFCLMFYASTTDAATIVVGRNGFGNDSRTKLLLHFDNSTLDSSVNNKTVTNYSTVDNATTYKFGAHSRYFNGTYFKLSADSDFDFGTNDFTIDLWFYKTSTQTWQCLLSNWDNNNSSNFMNFYLTNGSGKVSWDDRVTGGPGENYLVSNSALSTNAWYHLAVVRYNGTSTLYINGVPQNGTGTVHANNNLAYNHWIYSGYQYGDATTYLRGYMDELRISKGIARWTHNFSVPNREF